MTIQELIDVLRSYPDPDIYVFLAPGDGDVMVRGVKKVASRLGGEEVYIFPTVYGLFYRRDVVDL